MIDNFRQFKDDDFVVLHEKKELKIAFELI